MNKEKKLKMEINHIARHQELDKLNYSDARFFCLGALAVISSFAAILQNISSIDRYVKFKLTLYIVLFLTIIILLIYAFFNSRRANKHFMKREKMIERRLLHFGIKKGDIDKEFEDTKD